MRYAKFVVSTVQALLVLWLLFAPPDQLAASPGATPVPRRAVALAARSWQRLDRGSTREIVFAATVSYEVAIDDNTDEEDERDLFAWLDAGEHASFGLGSVLPSLDFDGPAPPAFADPRPVYLLCHRLSC